MFGKQLFILISLVSVSSCSAIMPKKVSQSDRDAKLKWIDFSVTIDDNTPEKRRAYTYDHQCAFSSSDGFTASSDFTYKDRLGFRLTAEGFAKDDLGGESRELDFGNLNSRSTLSVTLRKRVDGDELLYAYSSSTCTLGLTKKSARVLEGKIKCVDFNKRSTTSSGHRLTIDFACTY